MQAFQFFLNFFFCLGLEQELGRVGDRVPHVEADSGKLREAEAAAGLTRGRDQGGGTGCCILSSLLHPPPSPC